MTGAMRLGAVASLVLALIGFFWMQTTLISGAVIAPGQVLVRGKPKVVQSLDGGVVASIFAKDGDMVKAGDALLRLDPTLLQVNLDIYRSRLAEVVARRARLEAEYLGNPEIQFPATPEQLKGMSLDQHFAGQTEVFVARQEVLQGRKDQLAERVLQFENQIDGIEGQLIATRDQLDFIERDLESTRALNKDGLARESEVLELQSRRAGLLGELATQQAELARIRNSIRDTELEMLQVDREFKEQVVTELREATASHEELLLEIVNVEKKLERIDIVSPSDGVVHEMQVTTVGSVVAPEAVILQIVPLSEGVEFEARVDPILIDQVFVGQIAKVQFPAFNMRATPEIFGKVSAISPASVEDKATGQSFYRVEMVVAPEELSRLGSVELIPGMPMEVFLQTGERSVLTYLTKPLMDQLEHAFRDG
ncbi:HlyD family type I secretion periplasmic adaptor subunit [Rhodobacter sp. Har01]|uniref:HlyD family type I secretion periplasmic adaptor subunit n=1 Tax=Rhodobacter sp. Har01 TaxID=2883999 RepID=UPI001D079D24|nr:HlyD family type I secretion periplasmic adaptor subunit [Rhodobacter sp. Har01]MCB6179331.1 HlyD family type I secretion periplasmic adaptor subunit [Rhodobacter sp. Har01]